MMSDEIGADGHPCEDDLFLAEREQRIAFGAADAAARVFAQEENDKGKNQREADREGEWDDRHVGEI